ncbi:MAG: glycosyltransferase family 39 protein [Chloroflexi bacterium]|nr:glycosyltransferase family 39 protein [Chloroflexota bacterium]
MTRRGDRWLLWGLTLWGVAARLGLAALPRVIRWDEPDYLWLGRSLFSGLGYTIGPYPDLHYTPLLPLLAGPWMRLLPSAEWAAAIPYILCGSLLVWPIYGLARGLYGQTTARLAALFVALLPALTISPLYWGTLTEPPYLLLLFSGLYAARRALDEGRLGLPMAAGAALALAYLARPEGALTLGLVLLWLVGAAAAQRFRRGQVALLVLLTWLLVAGPYLGYLRVHSGRWLLTGKVGVTLALGEGAVAHDPAAYDRAIASLDQTGEEIIWFSPERFEEPGLWETAVSQPGAVLARMRANLGAWAGAFFNLRMFPSPLLALVALGLFRRPWSRRETLGHAFLATMLLPPFAFLPLHMEVRFFAPLLPILLIWAAAGAAGLGAWLQASWTAVWLGLRPAGWGRRCWPWLPALVVAAGLVALWPGTLRAGQASLDFGHKALGLWLSAHTPAGTVVMARDLAVPLYAERGYAPAPHATLEQTLRYAQAHGATYWATDAYELTQVKPHLAGLLEPSRRPAGVDLVYSVESARGLNFVFRLPHNAGGEP